MKPSSAVTVSIVVYAVFAFLLLSSSIIFAAVYSMRAADASKATSDLNVRVFSEIETARRMRESAEKIAAQSLAIGSAVAPPPEDVISAWSVEDGPTPLASKDANLLLREAALANFAATSAPPLVRLIPGENILMRGGLLTATLPTTLTVRGDVFRFLKISVAVEGMIDFLDPDAQYSLLAPALTARIVRGPDLTIAPSPTNAAMTPATLLRVTALPLASGSTASFARAVPFSVNGDIEIAFTPESFAESGDLQIAGFGDIVQILPVGFERATISSMSVFVRRDSGFGTSALVWTPKPELSDTEMRALAA